MWLLSQAPSDALCLAGCEESQLLHYELPRKEAPLARDGCLQQAASEHRRPADSLGVSLEPDLSPEGLAVTADPAQTSAAACERP